MISEVYHLTPVRYGRDTGGIIRTGGARITLKSRKAKQ